MRSAATSRPRPTPPAALRRWHVCRTIASRESRGSWTDALSFERCFASSYVLRRPSFRSRANEGRRSEMATIFQIDERDVPWVDYRGRDGREHSGATDPGGRPPAAIRFKALSQLGTDVPSMQYV